MSIQTTLTTDELMQALRTEAARKLVTSKDNISIDLIASMYQGTLGDYHYEFSMRNKRVLIVDGARCQTLAEAILDVAYKVGMLSSV